MINYYQFNVKQLNFTQEKQHKENEQVVKSVNSRTVHNCQLYTTESSQINNIKRKVKLAAQRKLVVPSSAL